MAAPSKSRPTIGQRLGALAYQMFCAFLRILDVRVVATFGRLVGYLAWAALPSRRAIVARNMRIVADPMLRGSKLAALVRRNIVCTCMNMACTFKTGLMTDKELKRAVTLIGAAEFEEMAAHGDCVIGCIPHAGNWEILARIRPYFPKVKRFGSMYRRLDNPVLEDIVYRSRTHYGCEMFSSQKGLKEVFRLAKDGGMLGVLSDQFTQQGIFLPYFGKVTGTTPLPSLIYKRCKERGHLLAVSTRNVGLGKWEAILSREIAVPEGDDNLPAITYAVNKALEDVQKESILDGFWMHHRWKPTHRFAPEYDEETDRIVREHTILPFRIIVCMPEQFDEAILTVQMLRELKACRSDMQLTVVCPEAQQSFWQTQVYITHVVTTSNTLQQLNSDAIYKDGPFDYVFMFSKNRKVLRELKTLGPIFFSGFADNPLCKKFRGRFTLQAGTPPQHRAQDYIALTKQHLFKLQGFGFADASMGNQAASGSFIAPFSTLGKADSWDKMNWQALVTKLGENTALLAFETDKAEAEAWAKELGISCVIVRPETVAQVLGPQCRLYAVDGLLPQLAALVGCECRVIMASRLAAVYAPLGEGHKVFSNHTPCHPCYRTECDQHPTCTSGITVDELLA